MPIASVGRAVSMAVAATLALAAAGGRAEAAVAFCGGPIHGGWCDPIVDGLWQRMLGDDEIAHPPHPANLPTAPGCLAVHVNEPAPLPGMTGGPGPMGMGRDADQNIFLAPFTGKIPVGGSVGYACSKSLGAVTRGAANGGMPHGVRIDDPALNGNPQAIVVATRAATPGASVSAVGAWYDGQHWWLYNEDLAPMGPGETFFYAEGAGLGGQAVHAPDNDYQGIGLYIDDARINGNPSAVVVPLHAFTGAYNPSALGVWYDTVRGQWVVYNESGSAFAPGQTIHYVAVP
jgi:hypothetical protein